MVFGGVRLGDGMVGWGWWRKGNEGRGSEGKERRGTYDDSIEIRIADGRHGQLGSRL